VIAGTSAPAYPHLHKQDGHRMNHHLPLPLPGVTGRRLRKTLAERPVTVVGAPFPLAAREIERQGFAAIYLSGAAFSAGLLGMPDIGLISQEHLCEQTARLAASVEIPVIVDADTGFGGPSVSLGLRLPGQRQFRLKTNPTTSGAGICRARG